MFSVQEFQTRWKSIRDSNTRSQKKIKGKSGSGTNNPRKYMFSDQLAFLEMASSTKETEDSLDTDPQDQSSSDVQQAGAVSFHDTELLILEIQVRPVIWNSSLEDYRNRIKKNDAWIEVCTAMHPDFKSLENAKKKLICK